MRQPRSLRIGLLFGLPFAFLLIATTTRGNLIVLSSTQTAQSRIDVDGINFLTDTEMAMGGIAHAAALDGTHLTDSQARGAGRSGADEIAANAAIIHRGGVALTNYDFMDSQARYEIELQAVDAVSVELDFYLPPGFLEYTTNAEFSNILSFEAILQAELSLSGGGRSANLFQFTSNLVGDFDSATANPFASSDDPLLDFSPLLDDEVALTDGGFLRTFTWDYDAFRGTVRLGSFAAGERFTVDYNMFVRIEDKPAAFLTEVLGGINDPITLRTDPLPQVPLLQFRTFPAAVPEPGTAWLAGVGLLSMAGCARRRWRRRAREISRATP